MNQRLRRWVLIALAVLIAVLAVDRGMAQARLGHVQIAAPAEPATVVADGKNSTVVTVRVTEDGRPCAGHLLQAYLGSGAGLLTPGWVFTDQNGTAVITYTPNPYSVYDPQDFVLINVMDTSIGRIIEVDKRQEVRVTLQAPES
jgi:hypothetical protein